MLRVHDTLHMNWQEEYEEHRQISTFFNIPPLGQEQFIAEKAKEQAQLDNIKEKETIAKLETREIPDAMTPF